MTATARAVRSADEVAAKVLCAREEERARLARELHDDIGQTLTLLLVRLRVIEGMSSDEAVRSELAELRSLVTAALDSVRRLSHDLGPGALDELGLAGAIAWLVDRVRADTGLDIALTVALDDACVRPVAGLALYRVAQEALTNLVRHAGSPSASVRLVASGRSLHLEIRDHGTGFDVAEVLASNGAGISGMRERATLAGGSFRIDSSPGAGTTVIAMVPREAP